MASGVENVYGLGSEGVNVVDSPIHLKNGEVTQAQNAAFPTDKAQGGLGMRGGLARINSVAMGSVAGVINVPLPAPGDITRTFKAALCSADADTWTNSTSGTSFTEGTSPARAATLAKYPNPSFQYFNQRILTFNRKIYYQADDYVQYPAVGHGAPPIRVYDGVNDVEVLKIPFNPSLAATRNCICVLDWCVHNGEIFLCVCDDVTAGTICGRVFRFSPDSGTLEQIGNRFGPGTGEAAGGMPNCLASHNGLLMAGTYNISGAGSGRIYSIRPDVDSSWTLRVTTAAGAGYITTMASYRGELHFGTQGDLGTAALWRKVATDLTTVATVYTGTSGANLDHFIGLMPYDGDLYAAYYSEAGVADIVVYDGTNASVDRDVTALDGAARGGQSYVYGEALYFPFLATSDANSDGFLLRKAAGTWTKVLTAANLRGYFGRVDVVP